VKTSTVTSEIRGKIVYLGRARILSSFGRPQNVVGALPFHCGFAVVSQQPRGLTERERICARFFPVLRIWGATLQIDRERWIKRKTLGDANNYPRCHTLSDASNREAPQCARSGQYSLESSTTATSFSPGTVMWYGRHVLEASNLHPAAS